MSEGKNRYVNIRYPVYPDFELKSSEEKNRIRLDVIHEGLLRLADVDKDLPTSTLEKIRDQILDQNFSFAIDYKTFVNPRNKEVIGIVRVNPQIDKFITSFHLFRCGKEECNAMLYVGIPQCFVVDSIFSKGKWLNERMFVFTDSRKEIQVVIDTANCNVEYKNLTQYRNAPFFQMMRAGLHQDDKDDAFQDWIHSLPPEIASIINSGLN